MPKVLASPGPKAPPPEGPGTPRRQPGIPDPEVDAKARRRRFTADYKRQVLREADACTKPGEIGALLRREGLYSSLLTTWRRERERGELEALSPKKRGAKPSRDPLEVEIERLRHENAKLKDRIRIAELVCEAQKNVARILGIGREDPQTNEQRS